MADLRPLEPSFDDLVRLDFYYLENWSIWLDIGVLVKTIPPCSAAAAPTERPVEPVAARGRRNQATRACATARLEHEEARQCDEQEAGCRAVTSYTVYVRAVVPITASRTPTAQRSRSAMLPTIASGAQPRPASA